MTQSLSTPGFFGSLELSGRTVLVLGGDAGAHRCVPALLAAGAHVRVLSATVRATIEGLGEAVSLHPGPWDESLLDEVSVVIVTGDDPAVADARGAALPDSVAAAARRRGVFIMHATSNPASRTAETRTAQREALRDQMRGTVALVGGGPGDEELLTLRGRALIEAADVVVADRLAPQHILSELATDVEIIDAAKIPYGRQMAQDAINTVLIDRARAGKFVVRFKGGDNFLFGRGYEEALACAAEGIPCSVVPGVTSAFSAPALAGIPVTHRGVTHEVSVISGHLPPGHASSLVNWPAVAQMRGTIVLLMAVKNAPLIAASLLEHGKSGTTPVSVIESASTPQQRRVDSTLETLAADLQRHSVVPPAIIVIGEVAGLPPALS